MGRMAGSERFRLLPASYNGIMRLSLGLAVIALETAVSGGYAFAQASPEPADGSAHTKRKSVGKSLGPVTGQDATVVFGKVQTAFAYVLTVRPVRSSMIKNTVTPVDRREVVMEFIRLRSLASSAFRMKMRPARYDKSRWSWNSPELELLVREGYIAPLGPITTNKAVTLSPAEFGDALGFFLARISQVTHQPSTKWTPYLQQPD